MFRHAVRAPKPMQNKHMWHLVQRILACKGPMNSKDIHAIAQNIAADDARSGHFFKQKVLLAMKEHDLLFIKSNNEVMRQTAAMLNEARKESEKNMTQREKLEAALQALHGINVSRANPPSKKQRKKDRTKLNLPTPKYEWHLKASPQEIEEWKQLGIPSEAEIKQLALSYRNSSLSVEQAESIKPFHY
ncbi:hypothetical protein BDF19DRAFT_451998 [Syncephalis fuscata]|nr:hypothetical protein BDF19DRAFT_451998 [Syncephalis fuscata]